MTRRVPPRVTIILVGALAAGTLAVLAGRGLGDATVYYYTPGELRSLADEPRPVRVGGTVEQGSVRFDRAAGVLRFRLTDGAATVAVANRGAPPGLFAEGRQALVEGRYSAGVLRSSEVIVKHDEQYAAPEDR
jgi:cytochrome c-type biogenesis protein CcmE